jgi:type IV pilus assembly protein PilB
MYNKHMNSKIIKKIVAYAKEHEIADLSITQKNGHHFLWGDNGLNKHQLKIPAKLSSDLGLAYRRLLSLAPTDLVSNTYFKDHDSTFKISIIPEGGGEKIIINTVTKTKKVFSLPRLGLGRNEKKIIVNFLKRHRGLIVIGAEDNQGKTTTLYSLIKKVDTEKKSCYLLEKHRELELDEINRIISTGEKRHQDLHRITKSDSEIIFIDDANEELLKEAAKAALDGRLVIVAIKASSALNLVDKIKRIDYLADLPILTIFQKILAKNCPHCLKAYLVNESEELISKYWPENKSYKPKKFWNSTGCTKCQHSGNNGFIASFNLIEIQNNQTNLLSSIAADVLEKAANGLVSISKTISEYKSSLDKKL